MSLQQSLTSDPPRVKLTCPASLSLTNLQTECVTFFRPQGPQTSQLACPTATPLISSENGNSLKNNIFRICAFLSVTGFFSPYTKLIRPAQKSLSDSVLTLLSTPTKPHCQNKSDQFGKREKYPDDPRLIVYLSRAESKEGAVTEHSGNTGEERLRSCDHLRLTSSFTHPFRLSSFSPPNPFGPAFLVSTLLATHRIPVLT